MSALCVAYHNRYPFSKKVALWVASVKLNLAVLFSSEKTTPSAKAVETVNFKAAQLMDAHGNAILKLAYSYLHNMSDAEEILQDTLLKFLQTNPELTSTQHEKAWLLRVAANLSKNRIKYNAIRDTDELNDELVAKEREDLSFVWEAMKALPTKYREVIHLFYYDGYSTHEIADILNRKESTIRSDLRRGREALKAVLKEAYDFEE